jgi:hypothetical protein
MLRGDYLGLFAWNGIPVRMHVLAPLGWFFFNRLDPARAPGPQFHSGTATSSAALPTNDTHESRSSSTILIARLQRLTT